MKYEARNIQIKYNVNDRCVKIFELWEVLGNCTVFAGQFSAPVRVANKRLVDHVLDHDEYMSSSRCLPYGTDDHRGNSGYE